MAYGCRECLLKVSIIFYFSRIRIRAECCWYYPALDAALDFAFLLVVLCSMIFQVHKVEKSMAAYVCRRKKLL